MAHPRAYLLFKADSVFTLRHFAAWMWTALWQSAAWFGVAVLTYGDNWDLWPNSASADVHDQNGGKMVFGTQMFTACLLVVCAKMLMETRHWNWTYLASAAVGLAIYVTVLAILSNWLSFDADMYFVMQFTMSSSLHWLMLLMQCVLCLLPGVLYNLWRRERAASLATMLFEAEKFGYLTKNGMHRP